MVQSKVMHIDCHCHLTDHRLASTLDQVLQEAQDLGIGYFMQGGVDPEDWQRQVEIRSRFPGKIGCSFGVHPYFVAEHTEDECELALEQLTKVAAQADGLGEMGLDFRPHIMKDSRERQYDVFEVQIELATFLKKPMILHIVQAHPEGLRLFDLMSPGRVSGLVHAFNGSLESALGWIEKGFLISVGGAVTHEKNQKLQRAVAQIPLEALCLESDSPDQKPAGWGPVLNHPSSILNVALKIGKIRGMNASEILKISTSNFQRVFGLGQGDLHASF